MIFKTTKPKLNHYNIPPTDENHELLRKAKSAIATSHPDQALELLSTLRLKTLDIEITALKARLADLERTQRFGTESYDTETREHNKINKSIILLITALEKEIAQSFEFYDKIRAALKSRYETRLSQKLSNRQPVNLRLIPSTTGTTPQAANTFVQYDEGQIRGKLAEYYKDANGRLLLVGVPGAGKTTLLLQLELELLEKEITRIPVILNLARWSNEFPTLEAWLQEILPSEMGLTINKKMAANLIAQNRLILLLDGLDEVKEKDRQICLKAIGIYGEAPERRFIISSRIDEYKAIAKDAPVNSQIELGVLTYEQLIKQLEYVDQNDGSKRLLFALKEDAQLRQIATIPFYFNILQLLFARGKFLHDFNINISNLNERQKDLERIFIREMFDVRQKKNYKVEQKSYFLSFWASRLERNNLVEFELTNLKYGWCKLSKFDIIISVLLRSLVVLLSIFPSLILFQILIFLVDKKGMFLFLFQGILLGYILGFLMCEFWILRQSISIKTRESVFWIFKALDFNRIIPTLGFGLSLGGMLESEIDLGLGLGLGLGIGLLLGFSSSLYDFVEESTFSVVQISTPYQRFIISAQAFYFSIFQHWHFRFLLSKKGLLPFKLVPFLNDMVACNILETTGASWRFRHRILQDYFADQWVETEFEPDQK